MGRSEKQKEKTKKLEENFLNMNKENLTNKEIAELLGVAEITVERLNRKFNINKKPVKKPQSIIDISEAQKNFFIKISGKFSNNELSKLFGVSDSTIMKWRKKLNLPKLDQKTKWIRSPHPKGFMGGKHNKDSKKLMSEASINAWNNPKSKLNSQEHKQKQSDLMSYRMGNNLVTPGHSRGKTGYRDDLGNIYFRSSWEANFARYLNMRKAKNEIYDWKYEYKTFWFEKIKRGIRSYKPDFAIWDKKDSEPYYIELKGYYDRKSKTKLNRMRIYYPEIKIELFGEKKYKALEKSISHVIKNWEYKNE